MWRDKSYLEDIVESARLAVSFCQGETFDQFEASKKDQACVLYEIAVIGEAARLLSKEFISAHPEIPVREIRGMRNKVIHEYRNVLVDRLWEVVQTDLPKLIADIETILKETE
ncbi:MAG: DUF86 domain-containing protein [Calditrichaeota bacterium]|nr:DUF86 domain-containing protein [Calditrichota bacterium]